MNKLERAWSEQLDVDKSAGLILWYKYEGITLKLAPDTRYTPDFAVMESDGTMRFDETKGFMQDDAHVKIKVAAEMFPFVFRIITRKAKKDGGAWEVKEVG